LAIRVKINHQIKAPQLRVVTAEGDNLGVIPLSQAIAEAEKRGLDLIEISPTAVPPVAKIMDYGKYSYEEKKKTKVAKEWLAEGNRVKVDLFLIGRSKYMDIKFLKERLERIMKLVTVEYKVTQDVTKGPKGLSIVIEKK
jgi:translation initiation factor IF-3